MNNEKTLTSKGLGKCTRCLLVVDGILPAMFVQIDRRVQLMIDLQLASMIPLISPK